ncbi:MAG TPA: ligase-associated DNA damage response exonuclease [Puia sp.]|nr:ligase-associated DNA damage response exonuclease [Puia sp.]
MSVLSFTDKGIYCAAGDFYIDPWRPVKRAVITHAHSDHARSGSEFYLCHYFTKPILQWRLGDNHYQAVEWGEIIYMNEVKISLHPAGHIIGSSQIRIEHHGEVWVVSGDYKTENDGLSGGFEPIRCHVFISESTFGLPIYDWKPQQEIFYAIQNWILKNKADGKNSVLIAYSLGKAQRLLPCLAQLDVPIYVHGAIWSIQQVLVNTGISLPEVKRVTAEMNKGFFKDSVIIAPPGAEGSSWMKRLLPYAVGVCSGWMQVRGNRRRRNADAGFALSDHADWKGLLEAIQSTGAERVFATHGFQSQISRYLNETGLHASEVKTEFGDEEDSGEALQKAEENNE